jgi:hypothetical protein
LANFGRESPLPGYWKWYYFGESRPEEQTSPFPNIENPLKISGYSLASILL